MNVSINVVVKDNGRLQRIIEFIEGTTSYSPSGCYVDSVDYTANGTTSSTKTRAALGLTPKGVK